MAGLVGGDSDSSALTESGDETMEVDMGSARQSRRNSVLTGTPTEGAEEDEDEADLLAGESPGKISSFRDMSFSSWHMFISVSEYSREEGKTKGHTSLSSAGHGSVQKNPAAVIRFYPYENDYMLRLFRR
jgi:hypothetical protein